MGGGGLDPKHGVYLGPWGNLGSPTQKGTTTYSLSPNRQRPMAGALNNAIFNTWRRFKGQALYVIPPFVVGYYAMSWAVERNEFLNSKHGRIHEGGPEGEGTA